MYLEHISVVHSAQGDISRTVALEKTQCSASWSSPSGDWQSQEGCHIRVLQSLQSTWRTFCAVNCESLTRQVLLLINAPLPPVRSFGWEGTRMTPFPPYTSWQPLTANSVRSVGIHRPEKKQQIPNYWHIREKHSGLLFIIYLPV